MLWLLLLGRLCAAMDLRPALSAEAEQLIQDLLADGDSPDAIERLLGEPAYPMDPAMRPLVLSAIELDRPGSMGVLLAHTTGLTKRAQSQFLESTLEKHRAECCFRLLGLGFKFTYHDGNGGHGFQLWKGAFAWTAPELRRLMAHAPGVPVQPCLNYLVFAPNQAVALLVVEVLMSLGTLAIESFLWVTVKCSFRSIPDSDAAAVMRHLLAMLPPRPAQDMRRFIEEFARHNSKYPRTLMVLLGDRQLELPEVKLHLPTNLCLVKALPALHACVQGRHEDLERIMREGGVSFEHLDVLLRRATDSRVRRQLIQHAMGLMRRELAFTKGQAAFLQLLRDSGLDCLLLLHEAFKKGALVHAIFLFRQQPILKDILSLIVAAFVEAVLDQQLCRAPR